MKKIISTLIVLLLVLGFMKYGRSIYMPLVNKMTGKETVQSRTSNIEQDAKRRLERYLNDAGYKDGYPKKLVLVAFKEEQILQMYADDNQSIKLIKEYPFTAFSGKLGPKLQEGDEQIPEGVYAVEYLNPNSAYHLSIKVNYPNEFDKSKTQFSDVKEMGGDIFIHGKAVTIGCIPIGDEAIEEVFLLTQKAINNEIKIIISPRDFRINTNYPEINNIEWERELYELIKNELKALN